MKIIPFLLLGLIALAPLLAAAPERKLYHDVHISSIIITEQSLRCSKEVLVLVDIENEGTFTEDVYVELLNKPLQVHAFSSSMQVGPRSREQILIPLYFSEEPQGKYTFDAYLFTGKDIQEMFQSFAFAGCKTVQLTSYIPDQRLSSFPQQSAPQVDEEPIDLLFVSTLFILTVLLLLGSTALFKLFS